MKSFAIQAFALSIAVVLVVTVVSWFVTCQPTLLECSAEHAFQQFRSLYATSLRGSLFAGFLTLGGFLLSLKTFIIVNMKKEVYDSKEYKAKWRSMKDVDQNIASIYSPLQQLSERLFVAIGSCVATAVLQFTIGLINTPWAALLCIWGAVLSIVLLLQCLTSIRSNLRTMFAHLEEAANAPTVSEQGDTDTPK